MTETTGTDEQRPTLTTASTLLTFLIADLRDYTRFTAERGDEAAARLASRFAELCEEIVGKHDGQVIELRGDEAVAVFPSARSAVHAAIALQQQFGETIGEDLPVAVGIGLDAGDAVPVRAGYRTGALNLAARLQSLASNQIFASETVVALARKTEAVVFLDRGEVTLKGLSAPVRVIQIAPEGELPQEMPPLQPILVTHPNNLPDEPTRFIGREHEISAITGLLRDPHVRMVTLTGPGGTGKTRVALQVGATLLHDFSDGVFFVSLAALVDPALVPSAIAEVLAVKEEAGTELLSSITELLKVKHLLLVLDNYEQLLDASSVVATLLDGCRDLHVLVTSRIPLHLSREHEHAVPPLSVPDPTHLPDLETLSQYESVALFIERAKAVKDSFAVTHENAPTVAEICSRLDGLPLAIELAAARIKFLPPHAILQRLSSRLQLLTGGAKDRPTRQQTLRGTIDWSYSLLTEEEQIVFTRLSMFAGGCTFESADAVCNPNGDLDLLEEMTSLVDKSLLRQEGEEEPRFAMLETIREYAVDKLGNRSENEAVGRAHAMHFLEFVAAISPKRSLPDHERWLARMEGELENVRASMRWFLDSGQADEQLRLAVALHPLWFGRGHWSEGHRWLQEGLAEGEMVTPERRMKALWTLGDMLVEAGELERARVLLDEALTLSRELGDQQGIAAALNSVAQAAFHQGQYERATADFEESLRLSREHGIDWYAALGLVGLGLVASAQGQLSRAKQQTEEALAMYRAVGSAGVEALVLMNLGGIALLEGNFDEAQSRAEESLVLARQFNNKFLIAHDFGVLGRVSTQLGDHELAREQLRTSLLLSRELGHRALSLSLLRSMAVLKIAVEEVQRGVVISGAAAKLRQALGIPLWPVDQKEEDNTLRSARDRLGEDHFNRAWERGRAMSLENATAYALDESIGVPGSHTETVA